MIKIPLKDGSDYDLPEDFYRELHALYYGVDSELRKMRVWCLANPEKRKTRRGAKRFVASWCLRALQTRPVETPKSLVEVGAVHSEPREVRAERLAELRKALEK